MSSFRIFFTCVLATGALFLSMLPPTLAQSDTPVTVPQAANQQQNVSESTATSNSAPRDGVSLEETGAVLPNNLPRFDIEGETDPIRAFETVLLNYVINPIFLLSGGVAVIVILYSSFLIITSRAQEDSLSSAKNTLLWAFVGLGLVMLAYTIVSNLARIILEVL